MSILRAADISALPAADPLWRGCLAGRVGQAGDEPSDLAAGLGLPARGFASPLGFWVAPADAWLGPPPYLLEVGPPARSKGMARGRESEAETGEGRRIVVACRRAGVARESKLPRLSIELSGRSARVEVDEAAWPGARQVALLAVATAWRLDALDRALDALADRAKISCRTGKGGGNRGLLREGRALILDLADFEGPLTDPMRYLPSGESARLYRRLCVRLGLSSWRDRIDERAEVLEGAIETLSTRRDHRQVIALELLIILLLTADVAASIVLGLWE